MGAAQRREDVLLARQSAFRRKLERARTVVTAMLLVCQRPYVAWSGGKDSLVVLALVAEQMPGVTAVWGDDELEHDEQLAYVPQAAEILGARLRVILSTATHADWFTAWSEQPSWREPLPMSESMAPDARTYAWASRQGYGGVVLGLRAQERPHRRTHLAVRGAVHRSASGLWQANPLAWWTVADVWAAIHALGLPYNPVYDRLSEIRVPREHQRVGPLPLSPGWILRDGWPGLYRRLVARYGMRWSA